MSRTGLKLASFDGGGIRSLSQLVIMGAIMDRLKHEKYPNDWEKIMLPCEHFDLIAGSGTGGLIAIMFVKLRMSVNEVYDEFSTIVKQAYEPSDLSMTDRTHKLRKCLERLMKMKGLPIDLELKEESQAGRCASFVLASLRTNVTSKAILRTYAVRSELPSTITVIDAILATCAVHPEFAPISSGLGYDKREYIAAGLGAHNPVREVITEALELFGGESSIALFLSLGTGHPGVISVPPNGELDIQALMRAVANDCEQRAQDIERQIGRVGIYFRFSVDQGMQNHHAAQVVDPSWIASQSEVYLSDQRTSTSLDALLGNFYGAARHVTLDQLEYVGGTTVSAQSTLTLEMVMEAIESIKNDPFLTKLEPLDLEYGPRVAECMKGTRGDIIGRIKAWTMDFDAPNILWLKGYPGVGKSAVAASMVEYLVRLNRLGSSFFFQKQRSAAMTPGALWRTVAHNLARRHPTVRAITVAALAADNTLATTVNVDKLFRELVRKPLTASEETLLGRFPIIVIDGLDECGGLEGQYSAYRRPLLRTLESWSRLPRRFKLIVTSRVESDIELLFSRTGHRPVEILAGQAVEAQSLEDLEKFLKYRFGQIALRYPRSLSFDWPGMDVIKQLANKSAGLFIWAETAVRFVDSRVPKRRLGLILSGTDSGDMATLYDRILRTSFPNLEGEEVEELCNVVGTIILAKAPLSFSSLATLLSIDDDIVEQICVGLHSVLESSSALQFRHQSFVDFLIDPGRGRSTLFVNREKETRNLTVACLRVMKENLRFNICNLQSSYLRNTEVPDLKSQVNERISPHISYSVCFWGNHLSEMVFDNDVYASLQYFMQNQFLFWLEVLSLINRVDLASSVLGLLTHWVRAGHQDDSMVEDMRKFVTGFASVVSQSAPHIYISALPFLPQSSAVSRQYREKFPRTFAILTGGLSSWPALQAVLIGHSDSVTSVAVSRDGKRIASGSYDKAVCIWDADTGEVVAGPLEGHHGPVISVAFSPNGKRIVSGSHDKTIRVWDSETGEVIAGSFEGHSKEVTAVTFTPDGKWVASASRDKTIRVWKADTGEMVTGPLEGHGDWVNSVAFSPNGKRIVSGSLDKTIRVWDSETGGLVAGPFDGHNGAVNAVLFSPDGKQIASGSNDNTVRMWDAETGEVVAGPFEGHHGPVTSVAFSPDGTRVASGSWDNTVRVWGAGTGEVVSGPFQGHEHYVKSVVFTPDGERVISGSDDKTIRLWDAEMCDAGPEPFEGHSEEINSIAFSPDGTRIASGSDDRTICVLDSETGKVIAGPFEGHHGPVASVAFSPDGRRVVSGSWDNTVTVWDAEVGQVVAGPFEGHGGAVYSVGFSPDGKRLVSGSEDHTVRLWDAYTGEMVAGPFIGHTSSVNSVSFSPDGRRVASGSWDKTIRVWDVGTGEVLSGLFEGHSGWVTTVAFSPDGKRIVSGSHDMTVCVWDVETSKMVAGPFEGHSAAVNSVVFSPNGKWVASGSDDKTIRIWNAETGEALAKPFQGHGHWVSSVSFSPDGKWVGSGSWDKTIRMWDVTILQDARYLDPVLPSFTASSLMQDGWILGPNSELLLWVPPALRFGILRPNNRWIMGNVITTRLDLEYFTHGDGWSCCEGSSHSNS